MKVTLGPAVNHQYRGSQTNGTGITKWMTPLHERNPGKWVAGHLLCGELGGSGVDTENLTPLTSTANKQMSSWCETRVKNATSYCHSYMGLYEDEFGEDLCLGVRYEVRVSDESFGDDTKPDQVLAYLKVSSHLYLNAEIVLMNMSTRSSINLSSKMAEWFKKTNVAFTSDEGRLRLNVRIDNHDDHILGQAKHKTDSVKLKID